MVWSPLAGGLLSGKYRRDSPTARQLAGWSEPPIRDEDRLWRIVDVLTEIGKARGVSAAQVALAWLLTRPAVTSLVIGGRNEAQFNDNIAAASLALTLDERTKLDAVSKLPVLYPYWHQQATARRSFGPADLVLDRA
jgi:aryl-alcohol dehydrogenase-like predicted oxidoreductase